MKTSEALRNLICAEIAVSVQRVSKGGYPGTVGIQREQAFMRLAEAAYADLEKALQLK